MRMVDMGAGRARDVELYGSTGLRALPLVRGDAVAMTVLRVRAGGEIGRHAAPADQLFVVTAGRGTVSGDDGQWHPITAGEAVLWSTGEQHATRAEEDLTALVLELPALSIVEA